jgi:hypothetical protein
MADAPTAEQQSEVAPLSATSGVCGAKKLLSVGGVDVSAQNLCQYHYGQKYGLSAIIPPIVVEP